MPFAQSGTTDAAVRYPLATLDPFTTKAGPTGRPRGVPVNPSAAPDLNGLSVLVLEDEYCIADDLTQLLSDAGAVVLGPFRDIEAALAAASDKIDCALVDINLGHGPRFETSRRLVELGVPVVFLTGYDRRVVPTEFSDAPFLQKPAEARRVIEAVRAAADRPARAEPV